MMKKQMPEWNDNNKKYFNEMLTESFQNCIEFDDEKDGFKELVASFTSIMTVHHYK